MPKGVYPRTENQLKIWPKNLALGRTKEARTKANATLKRNGQTQEFREKMSRVMKETMHKPEIRKKHLEALTLARKKFGVNFRGGNGQPLTPIVKLAEKLFSQCGYIREYPIPLRSVKNNFKNVPPAYKVDFGNPKLKIAIELDGAIHMGAEQKRLDQKKDQILKSLGWVVLRLNHYNP